MNKVSLCLPYYLNPEMLETQFDQARNYPPDLRENLELVIVDDGSPTPARPPDRDLGCALQMARITVDIRWNQDAARNLGAELATHRFLLLTDIDHMVPPSTLRGVMERKLDKGRVYRFARASLPELAPYKPHPNSWLMSKELYDRMGGYDERFAGWYGTDADFRDRCKAAADIVMLETLPLWRVPREFIADASTTTLVRKSPQDGAEIQKIKAKRKLIPDWRPVRGSFPWERVV